MVAVERLLAVVCTSGPLVLVLDDIQHRARAVDVGRLLTGGTVCCGVALGPSSSDGP
jgi:hypothetical protein